MSEFDDAQLSAQERRVRDLLRGAADVGPMPDDVVARIDEALAAARPATPVASLAARRRPRVPRVFAAAAGLIVAAGAGVLALDQLQSGGGGAASSGSAADSAAGSAAVTTEQVPADAEILLSGTDYTDVAAVQDLGEESLDSPATDDATRGRTPDMLSAPQSSESASSDPSQRPQAERALACTKALGVDPASVVAVEIAAWRSEPAAFVVHRTPGAAEVVVVALDCAPGDAALSTVPVPS
ncbi:hypothetical protein [Kineococcus rhizosphaerae]|uniref:Uncharacterized protein n=1 Tax=Kineococcus rhizosphaerae TaxID=559628 RepID=A0A2T0QYK8_9ACTN|nr:hypothetical protein [Kineococcus rhizosphaerae]PRY11448.1 hypothetical protein CLV37_11371 [Kineococcus rhizosphaerae]